MTTDPIADMLTRIRNAQVAKHDQVTIPASRIKLEIARILKNEGYIQRYAFMEEQPQAKIRITLKYLDDRTPAMTEIKRMSSGSRRIYARSDSVPRVKGGLGIAILTTSKGIMTDLEARKRGLGGEVMCTIW